MPEVPCLTRGLAASDRCRAPLGLSSSDCESSTASRERRRVALAAKVAVQELSGDIHQYFEVMFDKFESLFGYMQDNIDSRLSRLETLFVCSPNAAPSVDDVLSQMLLKRRSEPKPKPASRMNFEIFSDDECLQSTSASGTSADLKGKTPKLGVWEPLPPQTSVMSEAFVNNQFGFHVGDEVGWVHVDDDIPLGARGVVKGFTTDHIITRFPSGGYDLNPNALYKYGSAIHEFQLGERVQWRREDEDVLAGEIGIVIGPRQNYLDTGDIHVRFAKNEWAFDPTELSKATEVAP